MLKNKTLSEALNEGLRQAMTKDKNVVVIGQLVDKKSGIFGTTSGLFSRFGKKRVLDFPVAESLMTSSTIGMSLAGIKPVIIHQRLDFSMYSMDAIINWISLWKFKSGGRQNLPITIRAIVGKGWGQGPQHSKSLYQLFSHLPGMKVAVPSNPYDAKGMLLNSIFGNSPTIIIENRALFSMKGSVEDKLYRISESPKLLNKGKELTIISFGNEIQIVKRALKQISLKGVDLIDLRYLKPLNMKLIMNSINKTRKVLIVEGDWKSYGVSAEILSYIMENLKINLKKSPIRIGYPDSHTPASYDLEKKFYINENIIIKKIKTLIK